MVLFITTAVLSGLLVLLYGYVRWYHTFWTRRKVFSVTPTFLLGNFAGMMLRTRPLPLIIQDLYGEIKRDNRKCGGVYQLLTPMLMVTDPEMLREILVKYFDHFEDRRPFVSDKADDLFSRSLLMLNGNAWREMRHTLSPAFTGAKLRGMVELMSHSGRQLALHLSTRAGATEPIDIRQPIRRFSADVIATAAYGTVVDSVNNPDNEFFKFADAIFDLKGLRGLVLAGYVLAPQVMELLRIPLVPSDMRKFFFDLLLGNMKLREEQNLSRPDMLQLLMEAIKINPGISDVDIVAQAVSFFVAGFESVATTASFAALEVAINSDIQERLRAEVDEAFKKGGGVLTYEGLQELEYLDMVVSETTRKYPGIPMADRKCTRRFQSSALGITIEKDTIISIPLYAIHHDPEYFPNPDQFDPERFSTDNKDEIRPCTFMPFGAGPRNCIGMRLAQIEVKLCLAYLVAACDLKPCPETRQPIMLSPEAPLIASLHDYWVRAIPRKNSPIK